MAKYPTISDAKSLVKKYGLDGAIVIYFKGEQFGYAEYGKNKTWCRIMKSVADDIYEAIQNGEITIKDVKFALREMGARKKRMIEYDKTTRRTLDGQVPQG